MAPPVLTATHWRCSRCTIPLAPESLKDGTAIVRDGRATCITCLKQAERVKQRANVGKVPKSWLLVPLGLLLCLGLIFPDQILFLVALLAIFVTFAAALAGSTRSLFRISIIAISMLTLMLSVWGIVGLKAAHIRKETQGKYAGAVAEIEGLLKEDRWLEAQARYDALVAQIRPRASVPGAPQSEEIIDSTGKMVEQWLTKTYGPVKGDALRLLRLLCENLGDKVGSVRKVRAFSVENGRVKLSVVASNVQSSPADGDSRPGVNLRSSGDPIQDEALAVLGDIYRYSQQIAEVEIEMLQGTASTDLRSYKTLVIKRTEFDAILAEPSLLKKK